MGEGKTEAALAAAEVLAVRFGLGGVTFAMPTQGTTDAMYKRVVKWAQNADPGTPVALLHGKAMLNEDWVERLEGARITGLNEDEFDLDNEYGLVTQSSEPVPSQWLLGRYRGLLSTIAVATIDQVLWAATRTKFVALRHAGLSGRVLVIDEVHSYEAYMSVFLDELLRWCGRLAIPVILVSATLSTKVRSRLALAWARGSQSDIQSLEASRGYPAVTSVSDGQAIAQVSPQYRADLAVDICVLDSPALESVDALAAAVRAQLSEGGCGLVIVNTTWARTTCARSLYRHFGFQQKPAQRVGLHR